MAKLCPRGKAAAKRKFKVYPSAYANMYALQFVWKRAPGGKKRKKPWVVEYKTMYGKGGGVCIRGMNRQLLEKFLMAKKGLRAWVKETGSILQTRGGSYPNVEEVVEKKKYQNACLAKADDDKGQRAGAEKEKSKGIQALHLVTATFAKKKKAMGGGHG